MSTAGAPVEPSIRGVQVPHAVGPRFQPDSLQFALKHAAGTAVRLSDHENRVTPFPGVALHVDSSSSVSKRRCACMETSLSVFGSDGSLRRNIRWGKGRGLS